MNYINSELEVKFVLVVSALPDRTGFGVLAHFVFEKQIL